MRVLPFLVAVADGEMTPVRVKEDVSSLLSVCWSPDNKRIAYHWLEVLSEPKRDGRTTLHGSPSPMPTAVVPR